MVGAAVALGAAGRNAVGVPPTVARGEERVGAVELMDSGALVVEDARGEVGVVPAAALEAMGPMLR